MLPSSVEYDIYLYVCDILTLKRAVCQTTFHFIIKRCFVVVAEAPPLTLHPTNTQRCVNADLPSTMPGQYKHNEIVVAPGVFPNSDFVSSSVVSR